MDVLLDKIEPIVQLLLNVSAPYTSYMETNFGASPVHTLLGTMSVCLISVNYLYYVFFPKKMSREFKKDYTGSLSDTLNIFNNNDFVKNKGKDVKTSVDEYANLFNGARKDVGHISSEESIKAREEEYRTMVANFYDLVTDFYEYGWGQSFHFGPRYKNETFMESIKRAEYHLANYMGLRPGMLCLDVGCGVGGPMRNIAMFSGAKIEGITINQYQVTIGNKYAKSMGLEKLCHSNQGDFQSLPWEDNTFDGAFAIEATCHSPDKVETFKEVYRVMKPGACFTNYEWIVTDKYDANNVDHKRLKEGIEVGNGLPTLATAEKIVECIKKAGFEVVAAYDANRGVHDDNQIAWYETLKGKFSLTGFRMTRPGRVMTHLFVTFLEAIRIAPSGTSKISSILNATAVDLVEAGEKEIFTPSFFFCARKPLNA